MTKPRHLASLLALALLVLGACVNTNPATEVRVVVHADSDAVRNSLSSVQAQLFAPGASSESEAVEDRSFSLTQGEPSPGKLTLPFSFSIEKGKASRFLLVVNGYRAGEREAVIERKVTASFQDRRTVQLDIVLSDVCYERAAACSGLDRTCYPRSDDGVSAGTCGAVVEAEVHEIRPDQEIDASAPRGEADAALDASMPDATATPDASAADADAAAPEASMDADLDATVEAGNDATAADTGSTDAAQSAAIASSGAACTVASAKACDAHNGRQKLVCFNGIWSPNGSCDGDTRCQTDLGSPDVGSCLPVATACIGKAPGDPVCDGTTRRGCGPDLLDYTSLPCPAHASCHDQAGSISCRCDTPYMDDGAGGCATQACLAMPCLNGGACSSSGASRSCDCSAVDYEGTSCENKIDDCALTPCAHGGMCTDGLRTRSCSCGSESGFTGASCEQNVDECARSNVCSGISNGIGFQYACADYRGDIAGYTCRGQFPDWSIVSGSGRFTTASGIVTDSVSGLQWEHPTPTCMHNFDAANNHCTTLTLGGGGWRLPTRAELISIVDYGQASPAIAQLVFNATTSGVFWTSSTCVACGPGFVWGIDFTNGAGTTTDTQDTSLGYCVRCVR